MNAQTNARSKWLAALCAGAVVMCGCFAKRRPTTHVMAPIQLEHPIFPAVVAAELEPPPDMSFEEIVAPPQLATSQSGPARPRAVSQPVSERPRTEITEEPMIVPELTAEESEAARAETQRNLDLVEKRLTLAWGRRLTLSQQDLVSKIRGFTDGAKEAIRASDWERGRTLSKKALVLAEQLAAGL